MATRAFIYSHCIVLGQYDSLEVHKDVTRDTGGVPTSRMRTICYAGLLSPADYSNKAHKTLELRLGKSKDHRSVALARYRC